MEFLMNILSAIIGGGLAFSGVVFQLRKQDRDANKNLRNNICSLMDVHLYKVTQTRNIELSSGKAKANKEDTSEIFYDIKNNFQEIDQHIQEMISLIRVYQGNSNGCVQDLLKRFEPLNTQYETFTKAHNIYVNKFYKNENDYDREAISKSKYKLDKEIGEYLSKMRNFSKKYFNHEIYEYPLKDLEYK